MEISSSKKYNEPAAVAVVTILVNGTLAICRFDNNFMLDIIIFCSYIVSHRKVVVIHYNSCFLPLNCYCFQHRKLTVWRFTKQTQPNKPLMITLIVCVCPTS